METDEEEPIGEKVPGADKEANVVKKANVEKANADKDPLSADKPTVPLYSTVLKSPPSKPTPPPPETPIKRMRKVKLQDEVSLSIIRVCLMSIFHFSSTRRE
jgi:hypothetical protein